jgi:glycosidase
MDTPPVEQIHGYTDEGTGKSYGFHGYWARDFTTTDQALGSEDAFREMVDAAHDKGIRVLLDVVMNHVDQSQRRIVHGRRNGCGTNRYAVTAIFRARYRVHW